MEVFGGDGIGSVGVVGGWVGRGMDECTRGGGSALVLRFIHLRLISRLVDDVIRCRCAAAGREIRKDVTVMCQLEGRNSPPCKDKSCALAS